MLWFIVSLLIDLGSIFDGCFCNCYWTLFVSIKGGSGVLTGARKFRQSARVIRGQRCIGVSQGPGGEMSGEQRILMFQMESYSLSRRFTVIL